MKTETAPLVVRALPDADAGGGEGAGHYEWIAADAAPAAAVAPAQGDAAELAAAAAGRPLVLLLDGRDLLLTRARVPARRAATVAQAVPFALEDLLGEDIDTLAFAVGPRRADGTFAVAVVRRALLDHHLEALGHHGITPHAVVPDVLALAAGEQRWEVLLETGVARVATGPDSGFAIERAALEAVLARGLRDSGETPAVHCRYPAAENAAPRLTVAAPLTCEPFDGSALAVLAAGIAAGASPIDFAPAAGAGRWSGLLRSWQARASAVLLAVAVAAHLGFTVLEIGRLQRERESLRAQTVEEFQRAFPAVGRVVNVRAQAEQQLQGLRAAAGTRAGFLDLLARVGEVLHSGEPVTVELAGMNFRDGVMDLRVSAGAMNDVETYRRLLAAAALQVDIVSAENRDGSLVGRLRVREAGR